MKVEFYTWKQAPKEYSEDLPDLPHGGDENFLLVADKEFVNTNSESFLPFPIEEAFFNAENYIDGWGSVRRYFDGQKMIVVFGH